MLCRYLRRIYHLFLAFIMPSAPPVIFTPPSEAPASPAGIHTPPSPASPGSPGPVFALPTPPGTAATGTITVTGAPVQNHTFAVAGLTFTFKNSPVGLYQVATDSPSFPSSEASKIRYAINAAAVPGVTASNSGAVVTITATAPGVAGNAIALNATGAMGISAGTLTGGTGLPAPTAIFTP